MKHVNNNTKTENSDGEQENSSPVLLVVDNVSERLNGMIIRDTLHMFRRLPNGTQHNTDKPVASRVLTVFKEDNIHLYAVVAHLGDVNRVSLVTYIKVNNCVEGWYEVEGLYTDVPVSDEEKSRLFIPDNHVNVLYSIIPFNILSKEPVMTLVVNNGPEKTTATILNPAAAPSDIKIGDGLMDAAFTAQADMMETMQTLDNDEMSKASKVNVVNPKVARFNRIKHNFRKPATTYKAPTMTTNLTQKETEATLMAIGGEQLVQQFRQQLASAAMVRIEADVIDNKPQGKPSVWDDIDEPAPQPTEEVKSANVDYTIHPRTKPSTEDVKSEKKTKKRMVRTPRKRTRILILGVVGLAAGVTAAMVFNNKS